MGYGDPRMGDWVLDEEAALPLLQYAYSRGINTWDTADFYSLGRSGEVIGKAIKKYNIPRQNLVLLTKCYFGVDQEVLRTGKPNLRMTMINDGFMVNRVGLSRKHILDAVDDSVAR